jgi:chemotaxis protein MotA
MDFATIGGIVFAIGCILGGQALEGGHASSLVQATAFIIVVGGTIGAVAVSAPPALLKDGAKMLKVALFPPKNENAALIVRLTEYATLARKEGVLALEGKLGEMTDPFMKRAIQMVVDGVDRAVTREVLETDVHHEAKHQLAAAKLWESAGGFAPTVGILGAVLGLIHVMENLADPSKLGGGIATAFVATVYGVGIANLFFLPVAAKIKLRVGEEKDRKTLILEAALSIQEGLPASVLGEKLAAYGGGHHGGHDAKKGKG